MKRLTAAAVALGALTVALTACGDDHSATDANGLRRNGSAVATSAAQVPPTSAAASSAPAEAPSPTAQPNNSSLGKASQTTCGEFRKLDIEGEKSLMDRILAENPGSKFEGSPNVALGTAKLVCLAKSEADKPVAVAIGIATE
ncbi:hypothetical protein [Nocardia veterana]|uniref:DUF732 domain-containing protein n=1 Tax=Nocardia veterana TaxID=132249 RepID=A0A7X6RJ08_9NOCA|nr:hypothetical protein [Nocardia veterana]NKY87109.1 hypothetical protein [Nocardia veterana]